jgi:hypothetical protein
MFRYLNPWIVAFIVLWLALLPWFHAAISPDSTGYLQTARLYAAGHWTEAIKFYWSPLFSWLAGLLHFVGLPILFAGKLASLGGGILFVFAGQRLAFRFGLQHLMLRGYLVSVLVMALYYSLALCTPDLWMAAFFVLYLACFLHPGYRDSPRMAFLCGVLGGLGFLAKAFLLVFFLGHFALANLWWAWSRSIPLRVMAQRWAAGMAGLLLVSLPWILVLSSRAGGPTFGSSSAFVSRWVGPDSPGLPMHFSLLPPASLHAVSWWDDADLSRLPPRWKPLKQLAHQKKLLLTNMRVFQYFQRQNHLAWAGILLAFCWWGFFWRPQEDWVLLFFTYAIFPVAFLLLHIEARYVLTLQLLLLLMLFRLGQEALRAAPPSKWVGAGVLVLVLSSVAGSAGQLLASRNQGKAELALAESLASVTPARTPMAACGEWNPGVITAFHINAAYYGTTPVSQVDAAQSHPLSQADDYAVRQYSVNPQLVREELRRYGIRNYLVFPGCRLAPDQLPPATGQPTMLPGGVRLLRLLPEQP